MDNEVLEGMQKEVAQDKGVLNQLSKQLKEIKESMYAMRRKVFMKERAIQLFQGKVSQKHPKKNKVSKDEGKN